MSNRERGVTLTKLDLSGLVAKALPMVQAKVPEATGVSFRQTDYAAACVGSKLFVVGSEGVGQEVTHEAPFEVEVYAEAPDSMFIFPTLVAKLTPGQVRKAATGEKVDLADLVRVFGARLESNFRIWRSTLAGAA